MLSQHDLPGCTSSTHTTLPTPHPIARLSRVAKRITRRTAVKALLGLSIPAAILSTALPSARPALNVTGAPAAAFAMAGTVSAFVGNVGLSEADLLQIATTDSSATLEGLLDFAAPANREAIGQISTKAANFRNGPGLSHATVGKLYQGNVVTILESTADWYKVRTRAGAVGWVSQEVVTVTQGSVAAVVAAPDSVARPANGTATTIRRSVNIRRGPGTQHASLGKLPIRTPLTVLGQQGAWFQVTTAAGTTGWVSGSLIQVGGAVASTPAAAAAAPAAASPAAAVATVSLPRTNLRQGPATSFASLGKLTQNARLTLVARHGDWFKVRTAAGSVGWVAGDLLTASATTLRNVPVTQDVPVAPKSTAATNTVASSAVPGSSRGAVAARVALKFVGARYVWGGASPRGFDCSGLVLYAYRQAGLRLPHKASAQFSTRYGTRINSIAALKTGDIVFFANTAGRGITHVALYVGNGKIVTANSPRTGVQLQSINTRYWRSHFAGAIRPS